MVNALEKPPREANRIAFCPSALLNMLTKRDILFKDAVHRMEEQERLGLTMTYSRSYIFWQGDHTTYSYGHLDTETINKLSWMEFVHDNTVMGPHPNQYRKYDRTLTWEEIEEIQDITK